MAAVARAARMRMAAMQALGMAPVARGTRDDGVDDES